MLLMISGHQRSGTTLVRRLCDSHSDITILNEFGNFLGIGQPLMITSAYMIKRWLRVQNKWAFDSSFENKGWTTVHNLVFVFHYIFYLHKNRKEPRTYRSIETTLRSIFPCSRVVGDKWPEYLFLLDNFMESEDLSKLIIYRDCRDVVSSTLHMVRTSWRKQAWIEMTDTTEKIARRWVETIELMTRYKNNIYSIRYEDLVREPKGELEKLGCWLNVDPAGFSPSMIQNNKIENYKKSLSQEEIDMVMDIAGPTMQHLGYI